MSASSWYRRSLFMYKGNREYTRTGYEAASARFLEKDLDVDCSERHYMITGSNSGIGLQTALEVARRGGVIHMVCRNQESATRARSEIITTTGNDKIHLHIVDLAKPRDVILWAQRFSAQHEKLHVLIHNAGCMVHERKLDEDGVEYNFAVNTLAVHILTLTFMPLLERSEDPRLVMVSSAGLLCVRLDPHDLMHANLDPFVGNLAYSQNKRQQVVMALWYAQRYNKVHFSSMHPGWADTPAVRTALPEFYETMKDNLRTPAQGADTVVWLAISKAALKHPSGLFFQDREPVSTHFPLAWTKSSIEEEDFLMTNIQNIYSKIYNKLFSSEDATAAPSSDTPAVSPRTSQPPTPNLITSQPEKAQPQATTTEKNENTESSEHKKEESDTIQHSLAPEAEPVTYPVLPPPPPSAEKFTSAKSEIQEVAEIHAPPASSQLKEDATPEPSQDPKPSHSPPVERKTDSTADEDANSTPSTPDKKKETKTDSTANEDANTTPSMPDQKKETTTDSTANEDVNSTPSMPDQKKETKTDSTADEDAMPDKKKERTDLHNDADDDASSTASTEPVVPEP